MKNILLAILLLGVIGGGIGYYMSNKTLDKIATLKTEISINSANLLRAFEEDENNANKRYLDKVVEVTGVVSKIKTVDNKMSIYLDAENDLSRVICQLESANLKIRKNDKITVKGICTGYLMDVVIVRAEVVEKISKY